MRDNPYELAQELYDHPEVDEVEARHGRITVAHVPDDRNAESIPQDMFDHVQSVIEGTTYQWDYSGEPTPDLVERHSVVGGMTHRAISRGNPELQVLLVV